MYESLIEINSYDAGVKSIKWHLIDIIVTVFRTLTTEYDLET